MGRFQTEKNGMFQMESMENYCHFFLGGIESNLIQMLRVILRHFFSTKLLGVGNI